MDRPVVLLLTDDQGIAKAIGMLLLDWGFEGKAAASAWDQPRPSGTGAPVAGILVDLLSERTANALNIALALRARVGAPVPILIQSNNGCTTVPGLAAPYVTILPKPVDPGCIRIWLTADGSA